MMNTLNFRAQCAHRYLIALSSFSTQEWHRCQEVSLNADDWVDSLALIHPLHYADLLQPSSSCPVRGVRCFPAAPGLSSLKCGSHLLWEYHCPIDSDILHGDHLFPYSFGGPTLSSNMIYLCPKHNSCKGSDIHSFPWERGKPEWLDQIIANVEHFLKLNGRL